MNSLEGEEASGERLPCDGDVAIPLRPRVASCGVFCLSFVSWTVVDNFSPTVVEFSVHARFLDV